MTAGSPGWRTAALLSPCQDSKSLRCASREHPAHGTLPHVLKDDSVELLLLAELAEPGKCWFASGKEESAELLEPDPAFSSVALT